MKTIIRLIALFFISTICRAHDQLPNPDVEVLDNGFKIVWFLDDRIPIVNFLFVVESGHRDDPEGQSGAFELLEGSLSRGSDGLSEKEITEKIEALGATIGTSTDDDWMGLGIHGLSSDAEKLVDLLTKKVLKPNFEDVEIKKEQSRLVEAWSHLKDSSDALTSLGFLRQISRATPYERGSFWSLKEFKKITPEDVKNLYRNTVYPKNSLLVIVGKTDRKKIRSKIESTFGAWKSASIAFGNVKPYTRSKTQKTKPDIIVIDRPGVVQASLRMGFKTSSVKSPDLYDLTVANSALGGHFNSRLNLVIRESLSLSYGITSGLSHSKDLSIFSIASSTEAQTTGKMLNAILKVYSDFEKNGVSDAELKISKDFLIGSFPLSHETLEAVANRWLTYYLLGMGSDRLNSFLPGIEKTNQESVQRAITSHLKRNSKRDFTIVISGPASKIEKSLKQSGFKKIKRVRVEELLSPQSERQSP